MTKNAFLAQLEQSLKGLSQQDIADTLAFYGEMIDDRIEEGLWEEEAVASVGPMEKIVSQVTGDPATSKISANKPRSRRKLSPWEILLLILGSPLWIALLAAAFAVVISVVASLWAVVISLWAVFGSMVACSLGFLCSGVMIAALEHFLPGAALIGIALVCGGLSIFLYFGCIEVTKAIVALCKVIIRWVKNWFAKKEEIK